MSDAIDGKPPTWFWVFGGAALIWNLIGLVFYYGQVTMTPEALATFPIEQQEFFASLPVWATSAYAIAVTAGVVGSILLLLRKAWAVPMLVLSLLGILVQNFNAFVLSNALEAFGSNGLVLPIAVLIVGIALVFFSLNSKKSGWLS